ncbi:MAG: sialate O-acetylesterase, partial [Luteolibacter sp.]
TPQVLAVRGNNTREIGNILVGEVWIASGQSNMERQLGPQAGMKPILNWEQEVATANHPEIREFHVQHKRALAPRDSVGGSWVVCSPGTVGNFSAVGYFFARDLLAARKVPVGIIHSSVGNTPAEAWTSEAGLKPLPDFADALADVKRFAVDPDLELRKAQPDQLAWFEKTDPGSKPGAAWSAADFVPTDWASMTLPCYLEQGGYPGLDGIIWFRREFTLPENWDGGDVQLHLGGIAEMDTTWVNGERVGMTYVGNKERVYPVPGSLLKRGTNSIAVRVLNISGNGGLYGGKDEMRGEINTRGGKASVPLSGSWHCKTTRTMAEIGWPTGALFENSGLSTGLYNGMISPLLPYAMRGVIWYQGEANVWRARQYRTLFPAMIADWRRAWGQGDFPFLFVQIAPNRDMTPELREAQLLTSQHVKNTAMVVTADCGDANDIHPANKPPVGARLALAARALAYGERIEYSGPVFDSMKIEGANAVLRFTHLGGGLVAKDGELKGFTVAGEDKVFHPAQARISSDTVFVRSAEVPRPVAVRYGWANVPDVNLFNRAGLPASPFRTDVD